jgi:hypothetical protein
LALEGHITVVGARPKHGEQFERAVMLEAPEAHCADRNDTEARVVITAPVQCLLVFESSSLGQPLQLSFDGLGKVVTQGPETKIEQVHDGLGDWELLFVRWNLACINPQGRRTGRGAGGLFDSPVTVTMYQD